MRWLDGITHLRNMNLEKLQEMAWGREAWHAAGMELEMSWQLNNNLLETDLHLSLGLLFSPKRPYKYLNM